MVQDPINSFQEAADFSLHPRSFSLVNLQRIYARVVSLWQWVSSFKPKRARKVSGRHQHVGN